MGRFTDVLQKEQAIEDSLALAEAKLDSSREAVAKIEHEKAIADSLAEANIGVVPEDERTAMIPIVKLAKSVVDSPYGDYMRGGYGQAAYSAGATALNLIGVPLNFWTKILTGYNPGISGERVMNRLMGVGEGSISPGWAGLGEDHIFPGPGLFFDPDDPDKAWGTFAPEGEGKWMSGEWLWETAEREAKEKAAKKKKGI
jgi:hypothetical protein